MSGEVLYYVHHHGAGHQARARAICAELTGPVTLLSSRPEPEDLRDWAPRPGRDRRRWITLPLDIAGPDAVYRNPDAGGRLHWAPLHQPGLQDRNAAVLRCIQRVRPAVLVADVSVEITVLARISGVPVVPVLLPGKRADPAHRLALDLATAVLAPWPEPAELPSWLGPWRTKIQFTGGVRARGGPAPSAPPGTAPGRTVLAAFGAEGPPPQLRRSAAAPGWRWVLPDAAAPADAWHAQLAAADVVVAHAGLGTIGDLAAARARAVIFPQRRPFGEQCATGELLRQLNIGPVIDTLPAPEDWPDLLEFARTSPTETWSAWAVRDGAAAAARLVASVAG